MKKKSNVLLTSNGNYVTYPFVINDIEGIKCHTLIDAGRAGASYASSTLIDQINKKPIRKQYKWTETIRNNNWFFN